MTTMDLEFYILYNSLTGIFKLIYRPKNFCWATSDDLSHLLEILKRVLVKYKNRLTFERTLVRLDSYKPRDSWGKSQEELYKQGEAESFKGLVEMTVQEAVEEIERRKRPVKRTLLVKKTEKESPKEEKPKGLLKKALKRKGLLIK